jgi:hypothetical protein
LSARLVGGGDPPASRAVWCLARAGRRVSSQPTMATGVPAGRGTSSTTSSWKRAMSSEFGASATTASHSGDAAAALSAWRSSNQSSTTASKAGCEPSGLGSTRFRTHPAKQFLTRLIPATTTVLSQVFSIAERGRDLYAAAERLDLEGIVAKRKSDPYRPETVWYKIKSRMYTQGEGRWELFQKRPRSNQNKHD